MMGVDDDLLEIIRLFIDNGGYSLSESDICGYAVYDELIGNNSICIREIEGLVLDPITLSFEKKKNKLVDLTSHFYNNYIDTIDKKCTWDEKLYLKNPNPLFSVFIDIRFLQMIKSDPQYSLSWVGYRGQICSIDNVSSHPDFCIKDICWGYDLERDVPVISLFLDEFIKLGEMEKGMIRPFIIGDKDKQLTVCRQNVINLIHGDWYSEEDSSIYDTIMQGIKIINRIFKDKCSIEPFIIDTSTSSVLRSIMYPTKRNYEEYISKVAVLFVDNLDCKKIKKYLWHHVKDLKKTQIGVNYIHNNAAIFTSKAEFDKIRSISLFELLLGLMNHPGCSRITKVMRELWSERSTIHHTSSDDEYDEIYYEKQDEWNYRLYQMLFSIIRFLDPSSDVCAEYKSCSQYGPRGHVFNDCGFNRPVLFGERHSNEDHSS